MLLLCIKFELEVYIIWKKIARETLLTVKLSMDSLSARIFCIIFYNVKLLAVFKIFSIRSIFQWKYFPKIR